MNFDVRNRRLISLAIIFILIGALIGALLFIKALMDEDSKNNSGNISDGSGYDFNWDANKYYDKDDPFGLSGKDKASSKDYITGKGIAFEDYLPELTPELFAELQEEGYDVIRSLRRYFNALPATDTALKAKADGIEDTIARYMLLLTDFYNATTSQDDIFNKILAQAPENSQKKVEDLDWKESLHQEHDSEETGLSEETVAESEAAAAELDELNEEEISDIAMFSEPELVCKNHVHSYHYSQAMLMGDDEINGYTNFIKKIYITSEDRLKRQEGNYIPYEDENILNFLKVNIFANYKEDAYSSIEDAYMDVYKNEYMKFLVDGLYEDEELLEFLMSPTLLYRSSQDKLTDFFTQRPDRLTKSFMSGFSGSEVAELKRKTLAYQKKVVGYTDQTPVKDKLPKGLPDFCLYHMTSFHTIIPELITLVGQEKYDDFVRFTGDTCAYNIIYFINTFNISVADFTKAANDYTKRTHYRPYNMGQLFGLPQNIVDLLQATADLTEAQVKEREDALTKATNALNDSVNNYYLIGPKLTPSGAAPSIEAPVNLYQIEALLAAVLANDSYFDDTKWKQLTPGYSYNPVRNHSFSRYLDLSINKKTELKEAHVIKNRFPFVKQSDGKFIRKGNFYTRQFELKAEETGGFLGLFKKMKLKSNSITPKNSSIENVTIDQAINYLISNNQPDAASLAEVKALQDAKAAELTAAQNKKNEIEKAIADEKAYNEALRVYNAEMEVYNAAVAAAAAATAEAKAAEEAAAAAGTAPVPISIPPIPSMPVAPEPYPGPFYSQSDLEAAIAVIAEKSLVSAEANDQAALLANGGAENMKKTLKKIYTKTESRLAQLNTVKRLKLLFDAKQNILLFRNYWGHYWKDYSPDID